jgi:hypothetical protein
MVVPDPKNESRADSAASASEPERQPSEFEERGRG